ncbi:MAG: alpha/beta hydrolase [Anaerolineales bacterium]|nr:alpha/beta hydrolase [Anaerolineales bacterium]
MTYSLLPRFVVDALGIQTSYYEVGHGNGRPTLLLHGMSTSADSYRELLHELGDRHWLVAPDLPGFGYSAHTTPYTIPHLVEWLAAFCDVRGFDRVNVVGHSFGGLLATSFVLAYPENNERLLLSAPAIINLDYPEFLLKAGISLGLVDLGTAVSQSPLWVNRQIKVPFHDPASIDSSIWERRLRDYGNARATADVIKAVAAHDIWQALARLHHPLCIIWGENDPILPISGADALAGLFPEAQIHRFANCGHEPMLEQQTAFHAVADQFLSKG